MKQFLEEKPLMIVEDDQSCAELTETVLSNKGYDTEVYNNPEAALEHLDNKEYIGIISDYNMPHMDGLEFLEEVRKDYDSLPFILYTGQGTEDVASKAISKGVTDYVTKGRDSLDTLTNRTENALDSYIDQQESEIFQRAVEKSGVGIVIAKQENDQPLIYVNEAFEELTGYSEEEVLGRNCRFLQSNKTDPETKKEIKRAIENLEEVETKIVNETKDGEEFYNHLLISPFEDYFIGIQRDITELVESKDQAEFLLDMIDHDLRNELQVISGYTESLSDVEDPEIQEDYLETIKRSLESSTDLLDLTDILKNDPEEMNVASEIYQAVRNKEERAKNQGMEIQTNIETSINALAGSCTSKLYENLLENSIKHSNGEKIIIEAEDLEDEILISLKDDGEGMTDEEKENFFERGFKGDNSNGTGRGGHFVKKIAENYNIQVDIDDSELGGVKFETRLEKTED